MSDDAHDDDALDDAHDDAQGRALLNARDWVAACEYWSARQPRNCIALANFSAALHGAGRDKEALGAARAAIAADEADWAGWGALGNALFAIDAFDDAIAAYAQAVRRAPGHARLLGNLGVACRNAGQPALAMQALEQAIALDPEDAEARVDYAVAQLSAGHLRDGFAGFEHRWRLETMPAPDIAAPQWHGEDPAGMRIGLYEEGGFGDTLQFVRYAPLLAARGAEVVLSVREPLRRLLSRLPGIALLPPCGPPPRFDRQSSIMSLPYAFGTTLQTIPAPPYLTADPARTAAWRDKLSHHCGTDLRIGLVWAGKCRPEPHQAAMDRRRSMKLESLTPLAGPGRRLISLQVGPEAAQTPPPGMDLLDLTDEIADFDDTAALVANLDVVVAVDTSTVHLAAAMGVPVLLLSRYDQCWRWMFGTQNSPWYPSLRILRQEQPGDWSGPIADANAALETIPSAARRPASTTIPA